MRWYSSPRSIQQYYFQADLNGCDGTGFKGTLTRDGQGHRFQFFSPGHFVLTKKGAWAQKFFFHAIRVEDENLMRTLRLRRRDQIFYAR